MDTTNLEGKSILLVEDDSNFSLNFQRKLEALHANVIWAQTSENAISQVMENQKIELVLIDLDFGAGCDGTKTTKEILKYKKLPIIICSSQNQDNITTLLQEVQIYGLVDKNSNETILYSVIRQAITLFMADQQHLKINSQLNCMLTQIRSFIDNAPAAIAMVDKDLCFIEANKLYYHEYNIKYPELKGMFLYDVFPETPHRWKKKYADCLDGVEYSSEFDFFFRSDESIDFVKWKVTSWYDDDGKIGGIILFSVVLNKFLSDYKQFQFYSSVP